MTMPIEIKHFWPLLDRFLSGLFYRFNLAIEKFLDQQKEIVDKIERNMRKPSYAIPARTLYNLTMSIITLSNAIQLCSTYIILKRYL